MLLLPGLTLALSFAGAFLAAARLLLATLRLLSLTLLAVLVLFLAGLPLLLVLILATKHAAKAVPAGWQSWTISLPRLRRASVTVP